ncbi:MAG: S9 family peptidase, partial [Armatimonadetes bacterium]|nr:S9 family peptidase [Armatimonadota bacterium]
RLGGEMTDTTRRRQERSKSIMAFRDYPKVLEEHYVQRMRATYRARQETLHQIKTADQAHDYVRRVRKTLRRAFRCLPGRTPLNPRVLRTTAFGEFRVEHVLFESRPDFLVSANLYLPANQGAPAPAVLFTCGHAAEGKAYPSYAKACIRLAREGYCVLAYDPINQGERDIYAQVETGGRLTRNDCCAGHQVLGRQLHACGDWLGTWRLWDGIRGVDYLISRPEVDASRLGVTGQSGGGTLSAYLWAMEPRLGMVASSCWTTSYLLDLENSMPADEEQYPPGLLAAGLDKIDFFMARAGEPALLLGQHFDFFDDRGLRQGHSELRRIHKLMGGSAKTCRLHIDSRDHEYSDAQQLRMLAFFNEVTGKAAPAADRPIDVPSEAELQVTPKLNVNMIGSKPAYEIVAAQARKIAAARPKRASKDLPQTVRRALGVRVPRRAPHHRRLFQTGSDRDGTGQRIYRFAMEPQPGILCILRHVCREGSPYRMAPDSRSVLYLPNISSEAELAVPDTMSDTDDFWMLDVRGLGEGLYLPDDPLRLYSHDYMLSGHAVLYGESLLGDRISDVLNAIQLLRAEGATEVHLVGRKQGAVLALLAGVLDSGIKTVSCLDGPESFLSLATATYTFWPSVNFPRRVLEAFDLPEARGFLGKRLVSDTRGSSEQFAQ